MLSRLIRMRWPIPVIVVAVIAGVVGFSMVSAQGSDDKLVIYNGRSHYGTEDVFAEFTEATGIEVELRGGTGPELYERLRQEGDDSPADVFITTDLANLWRAEESGLLEPGITSPTLVANVPEAFRDPTGGWWPLTTRVRVPVVSTERIPEGAVTDDADLGDPVYRGRLCLRTSNSEYNQSFIADRIAKFGLEPTRTMLESWMANDPLIVNSDADLLARIAAGECDIGLTNHYYLGRALEEDPDFPVAPAWPDQAGRGAHANVSGIGITAASDRQADAIALIEFLTSVPAQTELVAGSEFAVNPAVPPDEHIRDWVDITLDPIDVDRAGPLLDDATALMLQVGWN